MTPIEAIPIVALRRHNRLHQIIDICLIDIADRVSESGEGFFLVVGATQASTCIDIEAFEFLLIIQHHDQ